MTCADNDFLSPTHKAVAVTMAVLIPVICTIITTVLAVLAWWISKKDRSSTALATTITGHIDQALHPVLDRVLLVEQLTGREARESARLQTLGMIKEALEPVIEVQTTMKVKVDALWNNLAAAMANILHQPDPSRRPVDRLLEAFMSGTLTSEERLELRKYLVAIMNWEPGSGPVEVEVSPGKTMEIPVNQGEQAPAAILLLTMDSASPSPAHGGIHK